MATWSINGPFYALLTASSGTWEVPATYIPDGSVIECIGAGGNGGAGASTASASGGGGGGYSRTNAPALVPGTTVSFTVGNPTNFGGLCSAAGGGSGSSTAGGAGGSRTASSAIGDVRYAGGNGRNRVNTNSGGDGGDAGSAAGNGANGSWGSGTGANGANGAQWGEFGGAGRGGVAKDSTAGGNKGGDGGAFGGGGGAGRGSAGLGGPGAILVTYYTLDLDLGPNDFSIRLDGVGAVTWTVPAECTSIKEVHVFGPGGNGGRDTGGGGGAFAARLNVPVSPGQALAGFIAAGGSEQSTWFITEAILKAAGGKNGIGSAGQTPGGLAADSVGDVVSPGGRGGSYSTTYTRSGGGGGGAAGSFTGNGGNGGAGQAAPSSWNGGNGGSANGGGSGGARGQTDLIGSPGAADPRGGGGGGGGGNRTGGAGGYPGGGGGGSNAAGANGAILIIYSVEIEEPPTSVPATDVLSITANDGDYAIAREGTGTNVYLNDLYWVGQYLGGGHDVNQTFLGFDIASAIPFENEITSAKLVLTVNEAYGLAVAEVRAHAWTSDGVTAFVPGSQLASKPLLGSTTISAGNSGEIVIDLTVVDRATERIVLSAAAQRLGVPTTDDDTFRVTNARLELGHRLSSAPVVRQPRWFHWL